MDKWNLFISSNLLLFDYYHFNTPFCVIFSILSQKEKFYFKRKTILVKLRDFFCILCWMDIYSKRLVLYQSGISMNISNTWSVTVLSNLQCKRIFSVLKKSCKNEYICPSDICLSDRVTSSSISLIIFSIKDLLHKIESYHSIHMIWWKEKITLFWVILIELEKVHYFFKASILSSPSDIILLMPANFTKHEFMKNAY